MPKLTGAERQRRWRAKRDALAKEVLQETRALPSPLDESVLIQNLQRLAAGDGAVSLKANTFLLTHCFGWSEYQAAAALSRRPGKKETAATRR